MDVRKVNYFSYFPTNCSAPIAFIECEYNWNSTKESLEIYETTYFHNSYCRDTRGKSIIVLRKKCSRLEIAYISRIKVFFFNTTNGLTHKQIHRHCTLKSRIYIPYLEAFSLNVFDAWCMMVVWNMTVTVSIVVFLFLHKNFHTFCIYSLDASWLVTLQFYWPKLLIPALLSNWILSNNQIYILYTYHNHNHLIFNWAGNQTHH